MCFEIEMMSARGVSIVERRLVSYMRDDGSFDLWG